MIEILEIAENTPFPIVDFKFQNRGSATAFLWKFTLRVINIEVDETPVLRHFLKIDPIETPVDRNKTRFSHNTCEGKLTISTRNDGWGRAINCEIHVSDPELETFFARSTRTFRGNIESGQILTTIALDPSTLNQKAFEKALKKYSVENTKLFNSGRVIDLYGIPEGYLPLKNPEINSVFQDVYGISHKDVQPASTKWLPGNFGGSLYLGNNLFGWHGSFASFMRFMPSAVYYVSLNPEAKITQRSYPISHTISPGDVERFQIMVGSSKSCRAILRFEFSIDSEQTITSEEFHIKIFNPMNSDFGHAYRDGDELLILKERFQTEQKRLTGTEDSDFTNVRSSRRYLNTREQTEFNCSKFPFLGRRNSNE